MILSNTNYKYQVITIFYNTLSILKIKMNKKDRTAYLGDFKEVSKS